MKILLDENIDVRLKHLFQACHDVYTVRDMQWTGIKNGELLRLIEENKFEVWIVVDKNIPYQQNIKTLRCFIIVLDVLRNTLTHLKPLVPKISLVLEEMGKEKIIIVKEG